MADVHLWTLLKVDPGRELQHHVLDSRPLAVIKEEADREMFTERRHDTIHPTLLIDQCEAEVPELQEELEEELLHPKEDKTT